MSASFLRLLVLLPALLLAGCQSMAYYAQAAQGQASVLLKRQPIPRLLERPDLEPGLRQRLEAVQRIRRFAANELGLPARRQYDSYVELGRDYPVWAVTAAPELSLAPRAWCYWLVGCLTYRGFFSETAARRHARELAEEGYEVDLSGVSAYSTLGWFRDPVLSSFITLPEPDLAELIFHELTHQVLYVPGDTAFNESLAVAVAEEGLRRYAARTGLDLRPLQQARSRQGQFIALVLDYRERLERALATADGPAEKRAAKASVYAGLHRAYAALRESWGGYAGYDDWFQGLNNARLNSVATYYRLVPALRLVLQEEGGDMARFMARCKALARLDLVERRRRLEVLLAQHAGGPPPT